MTDWLPELSDDDLTTLGEALEAWEDKDAAGAMFGDVIEMMVTGGSPPQHRNEIQQARAQQKLEQTRAKATRKERSVLLRAKLITLRERRRVEREIAT